jgi:thymidylate synthase
MTLPYTLRTESAAHWEDQYLALMDHIWRHGDERRDRTGVGTRSVFGAQIRCDLSDDRMPLLTTKRVYWKTATRELLWFLTGDTNIRSLCAQGGNLDRLAARPLSQGNRRSDQPRGFLGPHRGG